MKRMLMVLPLILIAACTSTSVNPDLSGLQTANDVLTSGTNAVSTSAGQVSEVISAQEIINNNSLDWWQWLIIGMFIPAPWEILTSTANSVIGIFKGIVR